ncbi:siderophore-interacting protein [Corynebacterium sp. H128]|uniref:siderophore-interacting protein n=1 Tax=Corynebacterium sp. H128 TaxID=3133427 RepID=UPI003095EDEF
MSNRLLCCTVAATADIAPNLRRITLHSPGFFGYKLDGPDEFFGLLMPQPGQEFTPFPSSEPNIRASVAALPADIRPGLRWYTIRSVDPVQGLLDFDVVLHQDAPGPGSHWTSTASVGDTCGFWNCQALWQPTAGPQVLVADATGTPALLSILDQLDSLASTSALVVTPSLEDIELDALEQLPLRNLAVHVAPPAEAPSTLNDVLSDWSLTDTTKLWASGEDRLVKAARAFGIKSLGMNSKDITFVPFWYEGRPRP